ncbi:hypothetical protein K3495_g10226 [Podosphaera aphanis]|nr:hypothetical protein K3495_g10226 [Podosphaera aphanis]
MLAAIFFLMAGPVSAISPIINNVLWERDSSEISMSRYVDQVAEMNQRRQAPAPAPGTGETSDKRTMWNEMTRKACESSLESFKGVVNNPSGIAVCYNLPFLDNTTGVFEADLRLYAVAKPTGTFSNVPSDKIQVGLSYNGATVSPVNASSLKTRDDLEISSSTNVANKEAGSIKRAMTPKLLQSYSFVGQINKSLLGGKPGTNDLQKVLVPTISLSAIDTTGVAVNTSLSNDEATFVNGVFAQQLVPTKAQLAPPIQTLVVAPDAPFVVPGLTILIFPMGLIITGTWTILFITTLTIGTLGRIQYRDQFRSLKQIEAKGSLRRI